MGIRNTKWNVSWAAAKGLVFSGSTSSGMQKCLNCCAGKLGFRGLTKAGRLEQQRLQERCLRKDQPLRCGFWVRVWEPKEKAEEESVRFPGPDSLEFAVLSAIFVCHYGGRRPRISN